MYAMAHATVAGGSGFEVSGAVFLGVLSLTGLQWWERRIPT
jgi:hypothetical protein